MQSLSRIWCFATPWTSACQASLSFTISQTLLKRSNNIQPHITAPPGWALFPLRWIVQPGQRNTGLNQLWVQILAQPLSSYLNLNTLLSVYAVVVCQWLSHVWLFVTPWTAVHQAPLSSIISWSLLKFMSTEFVMPSNHFILCHPLLLLPSIFPSIKLFTSGVQSIGDSASASVLPVNIQAWFPLGWTGLISL